MGPGKQEQRKCTPRQRPAAPRYLQGGGALLLVLASLSSPAHAQVQVQPIQRAALDALRGALPTSTCPQLWSYTCSGRKICDMTGNILSMNWASCGLSGYVPSEVSGLFTLTALSAGNNRITSLPNQFSSLTRLVNLNFQNNLISGSVPAWLVNMPRLADLNLNNNKLSGALPASYSASLKSINLGSNAITGALPAGIASLSGLSTLILSNNQLSESVPLGYGSLPLITLNINSNLISSLGSLANFPRLQNLYASNNLLTSLPEVGDGGDLRNLFLQNNQITGGFPDSWTNLGRVYFIDISGNQLTGPIPEFIFSLQSLNEMNMAGNFFYGPIPSFACSDGVYPFVLSSNCASYAADFPCAVEGMKDAGTCRDFCGEACVPVLPGVDLTSAPLGGCLQCSSQGIGYLLDSASGHVQYQNPDFPPSSKGAGSRNIQKYLTVGPSGAGGIIGTSGASTWESCCTACAQAEGCSFWHFYPPQGGDVPASQGGSPGVFCYLLSVNPPQALLPALQAVDTTLPVSHVGGKCNPAAQVVDDPHFVGARGTRFDFSGELGRSFCLVSDATVHINVLIKGYLDTRLEEATKVVEGMAVRSWIKETSILWRTPLGGVMRVSMAARPGLVDDSLADSYLHRLTVDGAPARLPLVGEEVQLGNGVVLAFKGLKKKGRSPMAVYELYLGDEVKLGVNLRPAHHKLQTSDDSQIHINLHLLRVQTTEGVHGILGQTFRDDSDRVRRARIFTEIARAIRAPVAADGKSGQGFLDGEPMDYATTALSAPDCHFAHKAWKRRWTFSD